jgi:hypothetical protein
MIAEDYAQLDGSGEGARRKAPDAGVDRGVHHVFLDVPLVPEKGERGDYGVDMTLPEDLGQLSAGGEVNRLRNERVAD